MKNNKSQSNQGKWQHRERKKEREIYRVKERQKQTIGLWDNLYWMFSLPIILQAVLSESNGPELKTRFLLLWSKPSCPILPMSCVLETHLNDNKTEVLKMFQLIFIWQWENIVCFDCNCSQTLKWFLLTYLF